jgi:hypothetical protein
MNDAPTVLVGKFYHRIPRPRATYLCVWGVEAEAI